MVSKPEPILVAQALKELADTVKYIVSHGEDEFKNRSSESDLLYLASCQVIIRLQAMIEDLPRQALAICEDLPLAQVRGMRNRMAHGYLDIDKSLLWQTMSGDILPLIETLTKRILQTRG